MCIKPGCDALVLEGGHDRIRHIHLKMLSYSEVERMQESMNYLARQKPAPEGSKMMDTPGDSL